MKTSNALLSLLHAYFHDWMAGQRSASRHTILSYGDTWRLFLRFVAKHNQRDVARLSLADLSDHQVLAFLDDLEKTHGRTISTRNCRLAALHSFFGFVADRDPLAAGQCAAVLRIPHKRAPKRTGAYLESEELAVLMAQPDRKTKLGERDHVLLAVLYNTGARIAEALNVRRSDIRLDSPAQVRVCGKGRKERISPLWPETVELLDAFLKRNPVAPDEVIFRNRYGNPLGASGVRFRLKRYLQAAAQKVPRLSEKRVSPHTLRHTAAVHLLASGVDVTIIRDWMGHISSDTTNLYAQANLETKRRALEKADGVLRPKLRRNILDWTRNRGHSPRLYPGALIWCVRRPGRDLRNKVETLLAWRKVQREYLDGTLAGEFDQSDREEINAKLSDAEEPRKTRCGRPTDTSSSMTVRTRVACR